MDIINKYGFCKTCRLYQEKIQSEIDKKNWLADRKKDFEKFAQTPIVQEKSVDSMPLQELIQLLEEGWVVFDTRPATGTDEVRILTLVKG